MPEGASVPEGEGAPSAEAASGETEAPAEAEPSPGDPAGVPGAEPTEAEPSEAAPASDAPICERARACCRAYVEAIPSARRPLEERGCTEMDAVLGEAGDAADDACEAAIGGWRQSLQLTGIEVPEPCR